MLREAGEAPPRVGRAVDGPGVPAVVRLRRRRQSAPAGQEGPSPHPPSPMKLTRLPRSRKVKMLAIATAALLVLETTAEAATMMYDYSGHESYKNEDHYSVIDVTFLCAICDTPIIMFPDIIVNCCCYFAQMNSMSKCSQNRPRRNILIAVNIILSRSRWATL